MKKTVIIFAIISLAMLLLCSCSLLNSGDTESRPEISVPADTPSPDPETEALLNTVTGGVDLDSLSLDELLALYDKFLEGENDAMNDGAEYDLYYRDVETVSGADAETGYDFPENTQTAVYSDKAWEDKTYETLDITADMSPSDKAGYEAAMKELENFDAEEFQAGIDAMIEGLEGFEDYEPGDYSEYDPDDDDPVIMNEWPDNEITRQVPKPAFASPTIVAGSDGITVMSNSSTLNEAKSYVKQLKYAGFTKDVYEDTNSVAGYDIYTFTAENQNGLSVSLTFAAGTVTVSISKD